MHSRIFCLREEIEEDFDVCNTASTFEESFCSSVGDYVNPLTGEDELKDSIEWLTTCLKRFDKVEINGNKITFKVGFNLEYFKKQFEELKTKVNEMSLEQFASNTLECYELGKLVEETFAFYVNTCDYDYDTLDSFVRYACSGNKDITFYVLGAIDYHY